MSDIEVSEHIAAAPAELYEMVSDLPRMGEWSPENTGGRWSGGTRTAKVGATFRGRNRSGWRRWRTVVTVTAAEPGRRFAFDVHFAAVPISTWEYTFTAADGGCLVTESWTERRPGWMRALSGPVMAIPDRVEHNRAGMEATLRALKSAAERKAAP
jgi:hypothetical protein